MFLSIGHGILTAGTIFSFRSHFARVVISFGEMIKFTPAENPDAFESQRLYLEEIMRPELRIDPDKKTVSSPPVHE
jgi:hypothetical protein